MLFFDNHLGFLDKVETVFTSFPFIIPISSVLSSEKRKVLVAHSCLTLWDPIESQAPLSMGFSRQEYWSGQPFPSPGDLPNPGIKPGSPALQADSLPSEPPGNFLFYQSICHSFKKWQNNSVNAVAVVRTCCWWGCVCTPL